MPATPTRKATPADAGHEPLLGIAFPSPARLPVVFFLVSLPPGATFARPMPAGTVDVEGELVSDVRAA